METKINDDPSDIIQSFPKLNMQILCCRFWWLKNWEHRQLASPFWRIYSNNQDGGIIEFNRQKYEMKSGKIYLISPDTGFSSQIINNNIPLKGFNLKGGRISDLTEEERQDKINNGVIEHLFIHFTLGYPYDNVQPGIYEFDKNNFLEEKTSLLSYYLTIKRIYFNLTSSLTLQSLICELLFNLGEDKWTFPIRDNRVAKTIRYIENNINDELSNKDLAGKINMATNAFARLFKEDTGFTLHDYIRQKRIEKASIMLSHTNYSIDEIADRTGFTNRYHFSRIFKSVTGNTPAKFRISDFNRMVNPTNLFPPLKKSKKD
jgi:AraC-like DNA-binding protein